MLIKFWFLRGLHKNVVAVMYFSIFNVLCGAGGDTSFAPRANLVFFRIEYRIDLNAFYLDRL